MSHRILIVALECADPIFSGNGVYGRSLALALARRADVACVHVVCALSTEADAPAPVDFAGRGCVWTQLDQPVGPRDEATAVRICAVPVPASKWRRLDWHAPCAEFCRGLDGLFCDTPAHTPAQRLQSLSDWFNGAARPSSRVASSQPGSSAPLPAAPYTHVLLVDWTGAAAAEALLCGRFPLEAPLNDADATTATEGLPSALFSDDSHGPRVAYLNFRVFGTASLVPDAAELAFYMRVERRAVALAPITIALCPADAKSLQAMWMEHDDGAAPPPPRAFLALPPPIRRDVAALATAVAPTPILESKVASSAEKQITVAEMVRSPVAAAAVGHSAVAVVPGASPLPTAPAAAHEISKSAEEPPTVYLTCMVRLDPTKSAMRFVDLVEALVATQRQSDSDDANGGGAAASTLVSVPGHPALRVVPFLCGAAVDAEYAGAVRARLREVCPFAVIEERFMTPAQMAPVLLRAAVNAHPCLYDAYAMTIVEAAAFGVPSIVHGDPLTGSSDVGAAATLMRSSEGEVVLVDWAFGGPAPAPPALVSATAALLKAQAAVAARRCGFAPPLCDASDANAEAAERMSAACRERALSYTEEDVAAQLLTLVQ